MLLELWHWYCGPPARMGPRHCCWAWCLHTHQARRLTCWCCFNDCGLHIPACAPAGGPAGPTFVTALILYGHTACIPIQTRAVRVHSLYTAVAGSMWLGVARLSRRACHPGCATALANAAACCSCAAYMATPHLVPCCLVLLAMAALSLFKGDWCDRVAGLAAAARSGTVLLRLPRRQLVCLQLLALDVHLSPHGSLVAALQFALVHCCQCLYAVIVGALVMCRSSGAGRPVAVADWRPACAVDCVLIVPGCWL